MYWIKSNHILYKMKMMSQSVTYWLSEKLLNCSSCYSQLKTLTVKLDVWCNDDFVIDLHVIVLADISNILTRCCEINTGVRRMLALMCCGLWALTKEYFPWFTSRHITGPGPRSKAIRQEPGDWRLATLFCPIATDPLIVCQSTTK